jgi:nitrate reductase assembly molybdenum cofactor insertion protein NarJ
MNLAELLHEAAEWRLLGLLFECPAPGWRDEIERLAREVPNESLRAAAAAVDEVATEGQYHSVFGPGGPAPPREATYRDTLELGSLLSELSLYYAAFGYAPYLQEPPDHVAIEIGFVAYLKLKEAYAHADGNEEHASLAARATAQFLSDHLALIASPLSETLGASHLEYLAQASRILAARVGPAPRSVRLPILRADPDDEGGDEFACATS